MEDGGREGRLLLLYIHSGVCLEVELGISLGKFRIWPRFNSHME